MTDTRNKSQLWPGFAAGALAGAGAIFFLGTKRGRSLLKQALEISENLEENLGEYLEGIEEDIKDEVRSRVLPILPHTPYAQKESSGMHNVIDKIRSFASPKKHTKKVYSKD